MPKPLLAVDQILTFLAGAPGRIQSITAEVAPADLRSAPSPDQWSANDVLAHLRACDDMWGGRILAMIAEDRPTLRAINPRTWIKQTDYPRLEFRSSLQSFATQRSELLAVLEPLPPEGWTRAAIITGAGKSMVKTVHYEADGLARHERAHVKQIEQIVDSLNG